MDQNAAKIELLERIERERAQLDALLDQLAPAQLIESGIVENWSVRDILAHLVAHEQRALEEVRLALRGERLMIDHAANDTFNAQAVEVSRERPFADVRDAWESSGRELMELVAALPETAFDPAGPVVVALNDSIDGALGNNTYDHYLEHRRQIEDWLRNHLST